MKITKIRTFVYRPTRWNWVFLKMYTDEGLTGVGECTTQGQALPVEAIVHNLENYLIGKDPRQIELHWSTMWRNSFWRPSPLIMSAISGVEMAMWDILGKSLNVPVYTFLGGLTRKKVKVYHNGWWFKGKTIEDYARMARDVVASGARAIKWDPFMGLDLYPDTAGINYGVEGVKMVREAVGDDVELLIDMHGHLDPDSSIRVARAIEPYRPFGYEEPVPPDASDDDLALVARSINIPVITGEHVVSRTRYQEILQKRAAAMLNPDMVHIGGIMELRKIADMAQASFVGMSPHNSTGPVLAAANLQVEAVIPNFIIHEHFVPFTPFYDEILTEPLPDIKDGFIEIPSKPGLGIDLNEDALAKRPYGYADFSIHFPTDVGGNKMEVRMDKD